MGEPALRCVLPITLRVRAIVEGRWKAGGKPLEGSVWPVPAKSGHMEPSTIKNQQHRPLWDGKLRSFVLYSLRHTFLTRLSESDCDA